MADEPEKDVDGGTAGTDATPSDAIPSDAIPSDAIPSDATAADETPRPARRPTAAASAASRARRIGGARPSTPPASSGTDAVTSGAVTSGSVTSGSVTSGSVTSDAVTSDEAATRAEPDTTAADTSAEGAAADDKDRSVVEVPAWLRWVPAGVLSVCAIVMIVLILVAGHGVWYAKPSASTVRDQVLAAAKTCTAATNTYSYQTLAQDEKKGLSCATGAWAQQYRKAITTIVKPSATKLKASQSVQINNAGIENISSNGRQWTIVLFGQTKITQADQTKPRLDPFSAQVIMRHVGGSWLISQINTIVNPSG